MTNGNTLKIIVGVFSSALVFIGGGIINNDVRNNAQHTEIRKEMITRDEKLVENLHRFDVRQEVLIDVVERIEKKL